MIFKHNTLALTLVLIALLQLSTQKTFPRLPLEVLQVMGSRAMRYHHFLWHNLREMWPLIDTATQQAIADLGWEPPRPSLIWGPNGSTANEENFSGEDFLYMHKQMVKQTNEILSKIQGVPYKKVVGFSSFPTPDDPDYPVPCNYTIPGDNNVGFTQLVASMKTDDFYYKTIVPTEAAIKDPENLRKMNLGQLGSRLEYSVHQYMHLRFSKKTPYGLRLPVYNPVPQMDPKWDDLSYQWLADTYSSQLNPIFWRIHGWVEDRIEDWRVANGLEEINWQHTWEGGPAANIASLFEVAANSDNAKKDPAPPVNLDTGNTFSPVGTDDNATGGDDNATAGEENVTGGVRLLEEGEGHHHMGMASVETMEKVIQLLMKATNGKEATLDKTVKITPISEW